MTGPPRLPPLRVEQALRLLPDVDALMPLRSMLVGASRARAPVGPYVTVGKRSLQVSALRELAPQAVERASAHLAELYDAAIAALEAEQRGDSSAVVAALLRAGVREEHVGRETAARGWYEHALAVAEELRDRRPEIEALLHLGQLEAERGRLEQAARHYQRTLALAEAEYDTEHAAAACRGLGQVALHDEPLQGAEAWFTRGLRYAEGTPALTAPIYLDLAIVARRQGNAERADELVQRARTAVDRARDPAGRVRVLDALAQNAGARGRFVEGVARYREALAELRGRRDQGRLELTMRLNLCRLLAEAGRLPQAEDEARRAEEMAIAQNLTRQLASLYALMGSVRGQQGDETGFVFFEKAIELCRGPEPFPRLEADVYLEYGRFRQALGDVDEARACAERAQEIIQTLGIGAEASFI